VATLVSAYVAGVCVGRCDAKCYAAHDVSALACDCVCGGANHGVGLTQAIANTAAQSGEWMKREKQQRKTRKIHFDMPLIAQKGLF
jgi:hypothetical protein